MSYFKNFPLTTYEFNGQSSVVLDIFRRSKFISEYAPISDLYMTYTIQDSETPQSVALEYYGSASYHWVILMFNEIHNPYFDWPLSQLDLETYCISKYTLDLVYSTKHYERESNVIGQYVEFTTAASWVPPVNPGPEDLSVYPVSFYEYEVRVNDTKREIHLLRPELLGDFVKQHESLING